MLPLCPFGSIGEGKHNGDGLLDTAEILATQHGSVYGMALFDLALQKWLVSVERFVKRTPMTPSRLYPTRRTQFVEISDIRCDSQVLSNGVPQGSVLGPIFLMIYTQPLGDIVRKHNMCTLMTHSCICHLMTAHQCPSLHPLPRWKHSSTRSNFGCFSTC